ncbi:glycosyltransferase involved in cell wall biosynthesis [Devosia subaequoris]|uniref:Glycosyltransferase involved in cell wall biosynthesis n=1 Tax=Devosia subaequoris TaxID=395930 RepID=A0A7W6IKI7_9HYPH|nr:glycosyltransferase family 4 protein [Devosia subaequoris]MBB4051302.1 glycosyltransferase involved in cell wall biosynthesis [Devosia subaequoris]MCP1211401.1 glycosyltransferase family 4 protein [Devosia subaequoris]
MNILIVSQYFWPENFRINDLSADLVRRGHKVTVLTGKPNYPGGAIFPDYASNPAGYATYEGADIVRVPLIPRGKSGLALMLNYLSFVVTGCTLGPWRLRGRSFDAIFVFQGSPVTVGLPAIVMKWLTKAPIALWVLDLWPQSLEAVGAVQSPFLLGLVDRLVTFIYRNCDKVLGQSRAFLDELNRHLRDPDRVGYLPSWSDSPLIDTPVAPAAEVAERPDLFNIVFTGNIGEAQNFPAVLDAAEGLRAEPVRWIIVGDGRQRIWLSDEVASRGLQEHVLLPGRFPLDRMPSFFAHADALLVSLKTSPAFAMTIPGKVQSYLAAGKPVLAMLDGEGATLVAKSGAGVAVASGDAIGLVEAVHQLRRMSADERGEMGRRGQEVIACEFDRDTVLSRVEQIMLSLAARG